MYIARILSMSLNFVLFLFASKTFAEGELYRLGILLTSISLFQVVSEFGIGGSVVQKKHFSSSLWSSLLTLYYILSVPVVVVGVFIVIGVYNFEIGLWIAMIFLQFILQPWVNLYNTYNIKSLKLGRRYGIEICGYIVGFIVSISSITLFKKVDYYILYYLSFNLVVFLLNFWKNRIIPGALTRSFAKDHFRFGVNMTVSNSFESVVDGVILYFLNFRYGSAISGVFFQVKKFAFVPIGLLRMYINNEIFPKMSLQKDVNINELRIQQFRYLIFSNVGFIGVFVLLKLLKVWTLSDALYLVLISPGLILGLFEILWRIPLKLTRNTFYIVKYVVLSRVIGMILFILFILIIDNHYVAFLSYLLFYLLSYYVFRFTKAQEVLL